MIIVVVVIVVIVTVVDVGDCNVYLQDFAAIQSGGQKERNPRVPSLAGVAVLSLLLSRC